MVSHALVGAFCVLVLAYILSLIPIFSQPPKMSGRQLAVWCVAGAIWGARVSLVYTWPASGRFLLSGAVLALAAGYDAHSRIIPNRLVAFGFAAAVAWTLIAERTWLGEMLVGGFVMFLFMIFVGLAGRGALGAGDVKLIALLAAFTGLQVALVLSAGGFLSLAIPGIFQALLRGKGLRYRLPYAPFLWLSGLLLMGSPYLKGLGR